MIGIDSERDSVFGERSDSAVQSAGQYLATRGLAAVGIPWFVTTGVTSYGGEMENAYRQGATDVEANVSAAITAGAEILTELLFKMKAVLFKHRTKFHILSPLRNR